MHLTMGLDFSRSESLDGSVWRAGREGHLQKVRWAVNSCSAPTVQDLSILASMAAIGDHVQVVKFLLGKGASAVTGSLFPAACRARNPNIFQAMHDHGWHAQQINEDMARYPMMYDTSLCRIALLFNRLYLRLG